MKKYIVSVASCLFALCMQSCFQDMDHPAFDYPESTGEVPTTPLKMYLPFDEEDIRDKGEWGFLVADNGNAKFAEDESLAWPIKVLRMLTFWPRLLLYWKITCPLSVI